VNLVIVKVVRNVLTVSVLMSIRSRQEQYSIMAAFLTPETGNRVDLGILKFGTRWLDFRSAVIFGETGQMSPDTGNPPKGVADRVMEKWKVWLPERHPRRSTSHPRDRTLLAE
jgi:hypothetical protein